MPHTEYMNKMNCNVNLPSNAIAVRNVVAGMSIRFPFEGTGVHTVERVTHMGTRSLIHTDKGPRWATPAGTVRLVDVDGYNYHAGHGCVKDA